MNNRAHILSGLELSHYVIKSANAIYAKVGPRNKIPFVTTLSKRMGNCASNTSTLEGQSNPDIQTNRMIERQIKADEKRLRTEVKLLLLGIDIYIFCGKTNI
jgi:hypothetical protein